MSWEDSILPNVKIDRKNLKQGWTSLLQKHTQKADYFYDSFQSTCHETLLGFCTALQVSLLF